MSRTAAGLAALAALAALAGTVLLAPAAHAAPVLTGKQRVTAASAVTVSASKVVKAYCPTGKVVIGGGAYVEGPEHVKLSMLRPVQDGHYLEAEARNPWGREPWSLVTLALCADPPPGLTYTSADSTPQAGVVRTAAAACPGGTKVIGLGGRAAGEPGRNVTLAQLTPGKDGTVAVAGSVAAQGGEPNNWTASAYAVCAAVDTTVVSTASPGGSSSEKVVFADCGPGKLAAVGAMLRGDTPAATGQAGFGGVFPDIAISSSAVFAYEDHDGYAGSWRAAAYAICA